MNNDRPPLQWGQAVDGLETEKSAPNWSPYINIVPCQYTAKAVRWQPREDSFIAILPVFSRVPIVEKRGKSTKKAVKVREKFSERRNGAFVD
ncbi:hypothetical protein SD51_12115 [Alicyclobacillus tengchongensis]|nr:hypothetical protein SD51_12115 [Alicyclobacillus tengchongensis]